MIITNKEIDEQQSILDWYPETSPVFKAALIHRSVLIDQLAAEQGVDSKVIVRARLGIKC